MTDTETAQVQQIRAREQQATPGPWWEGGDKEQGVFPRVYHLVDEGNPNWRRDDIAAVHFVRDCGFIAHARTDIPFLLDLVARQQAEIDSLKAESVQALARHYGCGEHVSFSDAWRWLAERVEMARLGQAELETFKSSAETALGAFAERIKAQQAEIDRLRGERDEANNALAISQKDHALTVRALEHACMEPDPDAIDRIAEHSEREYAICQAQWMRGIAHRYRSAKSSLFALREALRELHALVQGECPSLLNEDSGGDAQLALKIEALLASPTSEDR